MRFEKVKFFYSTQNAPGETYPCDNAKAQEQLKQLEAKGVIVEALDVTSGGSFFMDYHAACNAPPMSKRSVFGAKGATEENFGKDVPCLSCFTKADDRKPAEVFPRMGREVSKLITPNDALDLILSDQLPE